MAGARTFVIGERWTILLLRDLFPRGPQGDSMILRNLSGVAPNTLSDRLKDMEEHGLIARSGLQ
jgi:DNA-binding HxlR family transcriptional regulator